MFILPHPRVKSESVWKMATIVEDKIEADLQERVGEDESPEMLNREIPRATRLESKFEIIIPIDESDIDQKSLEFAIHTARNFSARLVILYITQRSDVPAGFLEFANAEGIRDYQWHYYNSLANDKLENIARKAETEGIEWVGHVHLGSVKAALRHYAHKKVILVLNHERKSGDVVKSLRGLKVAEIPKLGVSMLLF
jgi:nucleotide-binding universal stress UspA family protein